MVKPIAYFGVAFEPYLGMCIAHTPSGAFRRGQYKLKQSYIPIKVSLNILYIGKFCPQNTIVFAVCEIFRRDKMLVSVLAVVNVGATGACLKCLLPVCAWITGSLLRMTSESLCRCLYGYLRQKVAIIIHEPVRCELIKAE